MIRLYFHHTPNPMKVALLLEETGIPYEVIPVDTFKGEQHTPEFRAINPNGKTPAIVDTEGLGDGPVTVFDSNAILLYLAEKSGKLLGRPADRGELLSWLMFVATGLGPYSGQSVHFRRAAPEQIPYAQNRYLREAERHYGVLDAHLKGRAFMVGNDYTIVDIAAWGWIDRANFVLGEGRLGEFPDISRWFAGIDARPAVTRARAISKDLTFKREMDEEARRNLFPTNYVAA
jgi:GST-like protein